MKITDDTGMLLVLMETTIHIIQGCQKSQTYTSLNRYLKLNEDGIIHQE